MGISIRNVQEILIIIIISAVSAPDAQAKRQVGSRKITLSYGGNSQKEWISKYESLIKKISNSTCSQSDDHKYSKLLADYNGNGYYIPLNADSLDVEAIKSNLELIEKKTTWITETIARLAKHKWPNSSDLKMIQDKLEVILENQKEIRFSDQNETIARLKQQNRTQILELGAAWKTLMGNLFFLQSYGFPNDFQRNRIEFENLKKSASSTPLKINTAMMTRKLLEDGALESGNNRADTGLRTTLDTITIRMNKLEASVLPDDIRSDLDWVLLQLESKLRAGKKIQIANLTRWKQKFEKMRIFYDTLIEQEIIRNRSVASGTKSAENGKSIESAVEKKVASKKALSNFVSKKLSQVYRLLSKESRELRALFAAETILIHEVGRPTRENLPERDDILQIVFNRRMMPKYSLLGQSDEIHKQLIEDGFKSSDIQNLPWLNVLFKEGEFSFTYYFIPGVKHVFCPDQSRSAVSYRKSNLLRMLAHVRKPNWDFEATRYFSRVSMTGKIDMSEAWSDHVPISERPGEILLTDQNNLRKKISNKTFRYLYRFKDPNGRPFDVIEINDQILSVENIEYKPTFYRNRNPHYFKYFSQR